MLPLHYYEKLLKVIAFLRGYGYGRRLVFYGMAGYYCKGLTELDPVKSGKRSSTYPSWHLIIKIL